MLCLSVIVCSHNPHPGRLTRTVAGLQTQSLRLEKWELLLIDNASRDRTAFDLIDLHWHPQASCKREETLGLTAARRRGIKESRGKFIVFVDDDNVLAPDYLERTLAILSSQPTLGAIGGISTPEFSATPPAWVREFDGLLACRNLGPKSKLSPGFASPRTGRESYPDFAPIGAGMAMRRESLNTWMSREPESGGLSDRRGGALTSGGDNDIVLSLMHDGWSAGYFPELVLTHLIPAGRCDCNYLARLNQGIQRSWVRVLHLHGLNPWPPIPHWSVPIRSARAWLRASAWRSPVHRIRWHGLHGRFLGQADISNNPKK